MPARHTRPREHCASATSTSLPSAHIMPRQRPVPPSVCSVLSAVYARQKWYHFKPNTRYDDKEVGRAFNVLGVGCEVATVTHCNMSCGFARLGWSLCVNERLHSLHDIPAAITYYPDHSTCVFCWYKYDICHRRHNPAVVIASFDNTAPTKYRCTWCINGHSLDTDILTEDATVWR